jgi:hypothetical protein
LRWFFRVHRHCPNRDQRDQESRRYYKSANPFEDACFFAHTTSLALLRIGFRQTRNADMLEKERVPIALSIIHGIF